MSKGTNIKKGYRQTPIGVIPETWEFLKIADAFEICNNLRYPISEEVRKTIRGIYPYYGPTRIQDYINEFRIEGRFALIGEDGDHFLKWRDFPMTLLVEGKFNVNNHAHLIKGKVNKSMTEWFYYYFNHRELTPYLTRQGAGRYKLTKDALSNIIVAIPPLPEQKKIASILTVWDDAISQTKQIIERLKERNKGLAQQLLTGKKRLKGFSEDWIYLSLENLFDERNEIGYSHLQLLSVGSEGIYPQSGSIKKDTSSEDKSKYKRICVGDIGYNTMRMWQGRSALSRYEGIVSPAYTIIKPRKNTDVLFFSYLFKLPSVVNKFYRNSQGLVDDTLNCKFKDFKIVKVLIPPSMKEQQMIAKFLKETEYELNLFEEKLLILQNQKKGLMQKLLTGEIRVKIK